ncbi:hypothetical protein EDB81DRAFT_880274 [Dactylonectria macrodidyma]|uniref:Uncharacterized protein n=1 Tax=Dactylonectria macrodidyma TaxID=307937 RepID=A0A9P9F9U2_9HYPO|nr:hypothetical protein EDB81DRAFT_880274 [Dactylonectria macrodidyma]
MSSTSSPATSPKVETAPTLPAPTRAPARSPAVSFESRQAENNRQFVVPLPTSTGLSVPAGQLLRGATDDEGKNKSAALLVGIKLDLEAEVHLTARVKGDVCVGLY